MARLSSARRTAGLIRRTSIAGRIVAVGILTALFLAASASPAGAQFGALKRLKNIKDAVTGPDSAARVKDSLAKIAVANGEVVAPDTTKAGQSLLSRATSAAGKASDKFEKVTGVSAKDAALVATGAGVANVAAKKLGVDPMSLVGSATAKGGGSPRNKVGAPGAAGMAPSGMAPNSAVAAAMAGMAPNAAAGGGLASSADAQLMLVFQQEMMQVAMEANTGNPAARAKVEAWQKLVTSYSADAMKLSAAAQGGDMTAYAKMQQLQLAAVREWIEQYGSPTAKASLKR